MKAIQNELKYPTAGTFMSRSMGVKHSTLIVPCPRYLNESRLDFCTGGDCIMLKAQWDGQHWSNTDPGSWICVIKFMGGNE